MSDPYKFKEATEPIKMSNKEPRPNKCPFCMSASVVKLSKRKWRCDDYARQCNMSFDFIPNSNPKSPAGYE